MLAMPPLEKQCSKCRRVLSVKMFFKDASTPSGLRGDCKQCKKKVVDKWVAQNPIAVQTASMTRKARKRAKDKKIPFDLDCDYIRSIVTSHCPIFGTLLEWSALRDNGNIPLPNSPSLDRIVPERGYVKGNVWIISHRANQIKNNASHDELKIVTKAVGKAIVNSLEF